VSCANGLFDLVDELLGILLRRGELVVVLAERVTSAESALQASKEVRLGLRHVTDQRPKDAFVCEDPALKIGIFDCHAFDLSVETSRGNSRRIDLVLFFARLRLLGPRHSVGDRNLPLSFREEMTAKPQANLVGSLIGLAKDARTAAWQAFGRE
jgi:hypothetical protein